MDFQSLRSDIQRQSFSEVPLSVSPEVIQAAVVGFFEFLKLSQPDKEQFAFDMKHDEKDRGMDMGYRLRTSASGDGYDDKEFFHYNHYARDRFLAEPHTPSVVHSFLQQADQVFVATLSAMQSVIRAMDVEFPGLYDKTFPLNVQPTCVLRFLKYSQAGEGQFLAKGHYDRSMCTIAIAESAPGLRFGTDSQHVREVVHRPGIGLFFPGMQMTNYTSQDFPPSWHDVVQTGGRSYAPQVARWAVVFFCSPPDPNYFTREQVHTPLSATSRD